MQDLLDQVRQRAQAAEDALESAEERAEKYRGVIEENNRELGEFKEKVFNFFFTFIKFIYVF